MAARTPPGEAIDTVRVAAMMKSLGSPVRLELLQVLRSPRMLSEIRLQPARRDGGRPDRAINRVTVRQHVRSLLGIGAVQEVPMTRDGQLLRHFVVDHRQLFALTEELRALTRIQPDAGLPPDGTRPVPAQPARPRERPCLTLVNGAREGQSFPLRRRRGDGRGVDGWRIGRGGRADIVLDYDPYVSLEHAEVRPHGRGFFAIDLASRNGTLLNWEALPPSEPRPLESGDVLGLGRSALVFQA